MTILVLCPAHTHAPVEEQSCKGSPVWLSGPSSLKMIFALMTKVIAVYVWLTIVHLWYLSLKGLLTLRWRRFRSLVQLQIGSHKLSEQFIREGRAGAGTGVEIRVGTSLGPEVGLRDKAVEVLPEWGLLYGPRFLASSSSRGSIKKFWREKRRGRKSPGAILVDDLIKSVSGSFFKRASWPVGYGAFRMVKWST